jgi:basic membrane protein A
VPPPIVKRRRVRLAGIATALALVVAGASLALAFAVGRSSSTVPLTGCEVTDTPPLNDRAFNQAVFDGLTDAVTTWDISVRHKVSRPPTPSVWARNIQEFANQKCGLIVTVGGHMAEATAAAARANPDQKFLTTDGDVDRRLSNLVSVVFDPDQAAFLAGYLAAGVTTTGKVATFGGVPIPTVTSYMHGYAAGVLYYNRRNGTKVRLLGWDPRTRSGVFVGDAGAFFDRGAASRLTTGFISAGADIVMPVDGTAGEIGAGRAAERAEGVLLIGVDTDQHFATPEYVALWLTSVQKIYRRMVYIAMGKVVHGRFEGGVLRGTLANGGVGLAPFYGLAGKVPASLRRELQKIKSGIVDGSISVDPASYLQG